MKTMILAAVIAAMLPGAATAQHRPAGKANARTTRTVAGKAETLHVSAIGLDDEDGTTFTLKDAAGVKLEPVKVPLAICHKDHLGRLLPGMDVEMTVERKTGADGKPVRFVRPLRFKPWCS